MGEAAHYHGNICALTAAGQSSCCVLCHNPCVCIVLDLTLQICCDEHFLAWLLMAGLTMPKSVTKSGLISLKTCTCGHLS